jgi:branched-subunit amino acid aminotransferase/4-amino-4-deoxychorismate lyase
MVERLIESVRVIDGRAPLWPLHQWRIMNSALALGLALPEVAAPGGADRMVRMEIGADGVEVTDRDLPSLEPIHLGTAAAPHRGYPHKTTSRAWLEAARTSSRIVGADDALLFDAEDRLIEATRFAIGWWEGEVLVFPPLALGGLASVARARLREVTRNGIQEAVLRRDDLARRPLVACNAVRGLIDVGMLDGKPLGANPRTAILARRFWDRPAA